MLADKRRFFRINLRASAANWLKKKDAIMSWGNEYGYREYVPVGQRIAQGRQYAAEVAKKEGRAAQPVTISGKKIATTFWGKAWCDHLESYSDYANRLPRGRTYARNGSVADLVIKAGRVEAIVAGSDTYEMTIEINRLAKAHWKKIRNDCSASIDSLLDLLGGKFSAGVMKRLTRRPDGLFPGPKEINMECSCPDWAGLCKHLAAVLYGVGAHLDKRPELLFLLRDVDHTELIGEAVSADNLSTALGEPSTELAGEDLGAMFGIDLDVSSNSTAVDKPPKKRRTAKKKKAASGKSTKKKAVSKIPAKAKKKSTKKKASPKRKIAKAAAKKKVARKKVPGKSVTKKKAVKKTAASKTGVKKAAKKAVRRGPARKKAVKRVAQSK
jgi:uncharacterized Zn finger protein